jgi:hypothetical protein
MRPDAQGILSAIREGNKTWMESADEEFIVDIIQKVGSGFPVGKDEIQALRKVADRVEGTNLELSFQDEACPRLERLQASLGTWPEYKRDLGLLPGDMIAAGLKTPKGEVIPE